MLSEEALVHLREVRPGLGRLDYRELLRELDSLDPDTPLMLEHLQTDEEYTLAADYVRGIAKEIGVRL
jgi:sugar phosphate isomerase/epimerase